MPTATQLANLTGGRRAGVPNKVTGSIKAMVEKALQKAGGVEYLVQQAEKNPAAFMGLIGKILPLQIATDGNTAVQWVIRIPVEATSVSEWIDRYAPPHIREARNAEMIIDGKAESSTTEETPGK